MLRAILWKYKKQNKSLSNQHNLFNFKSPVTPHVLSYTECRGLSSCHSHYIYISLNYVIIGLTVQLHEWLNTKFESNNICSISVSILTKDCKRALSVKMKITGLHAVISHLFAGWGHVGNTTRGCSFLQQKWWIQTWQRKPGRWPLSWKSGHGHHTRDHDMMLTDLQTAQNCTATELGIS